MDTLMIILISIIIFLVLYLIVVFNGLIMLRNRVKNAWAQIDVQLKRRYNLIPNLIKTVKGYLKSKKEI